MKNKKRSSAQPGPGPLSPGDILAQTAGDYSTEVFEDLLTTDKVRIERIVSRGHKSAEGFWYDQEEGEWVLLVKGEAQLEFEAGNEIIHLTEGMHINIPAHARHRVKWTKEDTETVWLAVFYKES